eukprot:4901808-Pyramimonas_sp.AAC.1
MTEVPHGLQRVTDGHRGGPPPDTRGPRGLGRASLQRRAQRSQLRSAPRQKKTRALGTAPWWPPSGEPRGMQP